MMDQVNLVLCWGSDFVMDQEVFRISSWSHLPHSYQAAVEKMYPDTHLFSQLLSLIV